MACCSDRRDTDRAMIIDFIHYEPTAVDAAAQRLANSADCYERALGLEWLKMREREAV